MSETVTISKEEYIELRLFKKLVENKLSEELADEELKLVEGARKEKSMTKEEFLKKAKKLV